MKYGNAISMRIRLFPKPDLSHASGFLLIRSARIISLSPEVGTFEDAGVLVTQGEDPRIFAIGRYRDLCRQHQGPVMDMGDTTILPGLINAHTHLELSYLKGRALFGEGFCAWAKSLHDKMRIRADSQSIGTALQAMRATGTVAVADMSGYEAGKIAGLLEDDDVPDVFFLIQRMGFVPPKAGRLKPYTFAEDLQSRFSPRHRFAYAGHSLYSTHPETLQLTRAWCDDHAMPFAIHLAESAEEVELIRSGTGPLADLLRGSGLLPRTFTPTGLTPVAYAHRLGLLGPRTLAVHCVHVESEDIDILAGTGTNVCLCPRSNDLIGVGIAPVEAMHGAGIRLCIGTDGLSSNIDLNMGREMDFLLRTHPKMGVNDVLAMATINGATALGITDDYGSLEPGKKAVFALGSAIDD